MGGEGPWTATLSRAIGEHLPGVGTRWREAGGLLQRLAAPVPPRTTFGDPARRAGGPLEPVALTTADGLRLAAWYLAPTARPGEADPRAVPPRSPIVLHHHFGATRHDYLPVARMLREAGYPVLLFDARSHGDSDAGETLGLALAARPADVQAAVDHLRERGHRSFVGYGFSMGAAIVLIGASRCPGLRGLVFDSGPVVHLAAACRGVIDARMGDDEAPLRRLAARRLYLDGAGWRYHRDLRRAAARVPRVPSLIFHGDRDVVLPPAETAELRRDVLRGPCERIVLPGVHHVTGWAQRRKAYRARLLDFLDGLERTAAR